ncbi:MAG: SpoIID/LytB domain-containing protein [Archangium sp.]|nr:SpoIID/LytB domain-containing protein [Archangium sp.]
MRLFRLAMLTALACSPRAAPVVRVTAPPPEVPATRAPAPTVETAAPESPSADDVPVPDTSPKRVDFRGGAPVVPVRLMEGNNEVTLASRGKLRFELGGPKPATVEGSPGATWRLRLLRGTPASIVARIQLAEVAFNDKLGLAASQREWADAGVKTRPHVLGGVYGVAGKVIDNRRYLVLVDAPPAPAAELAPVQAELLQRHGVRTTLFETTQHPAHVTAELFDALGTRVGEAVDTVTVTSVDGAPIDVKRVEFGVGYDFHNFEDRSYRGAIQVSADRLGKLAVVNVIGLEDLLKGLVPSEIFARAHPEALKAQAVTARGEVLAKVGLKHTADAYFLCTEQHCAVYKGMSGEAASTNAAVDATVGEMAFGTDGKLVDAVYSAVCGGHTENNEIVWGGVPNPSLRGRPDTLTAVAGPSPKDDVKAFLATEAPHACKLSSLAQLTKYRWERRFTAKEVDEKLASSGVGRVFALSVTERGVSGRARLLAISGETGATQLRGELVIRRTFGMLNSAMFDVRAERDAKGRPLAWVFTGGGWGHGVGLCQTGAIGRAEAGHSYRQILDHYFNGAQVTRVY